LRSYTGKRIKVINDIYCPQQFSLVWGANGRRVLRLIRSVGFALAFVRLNTENRRYKTWTMEEMPLFFLCSFFRKPVTVLNPQPQRQKP
jgi:hypothetical protein